jgi:hypothetical protein
MPGVCEIVCAARHKRFLATHLFGRYALERFSQEVSEMLAAPKRLGSARVPACSFRRPAGRPCSARRRTPHAGTRMLPRPTPKPWPLSAVFGNDPIVR